MKIKFYTEKTLQHRQNTLFKNNQAQVYKELNGMTKNDNPSPDADKAKHFWSSIWSQEHVHDDEASWLGDVRNDLKGKVKEMENIEVTVDEVVRRIRECLTGKHLDLMECKGIGSKHLIVSINL